MAKLSEEVRAHEKYLRGEIGRTDSEPWFTSKKGSVIPAKRRSVKRMMFDHLVQSFASFFGSAKKMVSAPESSNVNDKAVFPYP